jgi:hypothetical protein
VIPEEVKTSWAGRIDDTGLFRMQCQTVVLNPGLHPGQRGLCFILALAKEDDASAAQNATTILAQRRTTAVRLRLRLRANPAGIVAAYGQSAAIRRQIAMPDRLSRKNPYDASKTKSTMPKNR